MLPIEYRSNGGITSAPEVGITDWRPRGSTVSGLLEDAAASYVNTSTGSLKQIVIAAETDNEPSFGFSIPDLALTLAVRSDAPKAYRQYVFRIEGTINTINGVESGLEKKVLRFSPTDTVEVFLNGVKLERGNTPEGFTIYSDSSSSVPPNTISFNTAVTLPGVTQVDVVVSAEAPTTNITLNLRRNQSDESRLTLGAWENVDSVKRFDGTNHTLNLYTIDLSDATALKLNTIMTVVSAKLGSVNLGLSSTYMLLARAPFTFLDRYTGLAVPLSTLSFDRDYLKYFVVDGESVLYVTETAVAPIYPPLQVNKFNVETTIQKPLAGVTDQIVLDGGVIVGPDV